MTATQTPGSLRSFDQLFVGGRWVAPAGDARIDIVSPTTEELLGSVPDATDADVDAAVAAARAAFDKGEWSSTTPAERAVFLNRIADEMEKRLPEMAGAFALELGAPDAVATRFHQIAIEVWRRNAALLSTFEFSEATEWGEGSGTLFREPVGVVAAVSPWNGPVVLNSLKISAALAAGCTVVAKPAPEAPVSVMIMAEAIEAAGLPEGVVSILPGGREVGEYLVTRPDIDKVSFTGSTGAGKAVMAAAADRIARVTLELGGKSAGIILEDADLSEVLPTLLAAGVGHSGQVCAAITRVLAPRSRYDEICGALAAAIGTLKVGDPRVDPEVAIGPLVAQRQQKRVLDYIELGVREGARVAVGGGVPKDQDRGWFVEPTLLVDVDNSMRVAREEIFGPVIVVIPYTDVDDAVAIANDSEYGLSGAVYSADHAAASAVARRIRTGQINVNTAGVCLYAPFGGFRQSGMGREGGNDGLLPYLETKLIIG